MAISDNYLLYAISSWKETPWPRFRKTFDSLYVAYAIRDKSKADHDPQAVQDIRRRTMRILDALGHCDIYFGKEGGKIYVGPALLARMPVLGMAQAIFCGSRSPGTLKLAREVSQRYSADIRIIVSEQPNSGVFVPHRIAVEATSSDLLAALANDLDVPFASVPPAWQILDFAGSIDEYLGSLEWPTVQEPNWQRRDFDPSCLLFRRLYRRSNEYRLSSYEDPVRLIDLHYIFKSDQAAIVDRDWGRFALLREESLNILMYDPRRLALAVPISTPLPRLLARSLGLCSGFAPRFVSKERVAFKSPETKGFDLYTGVPRDIAEALASKLGQVLNEERLSY